MNDQTQFYVQIIGAIFLGLNSIILPLGLAWIRARMNQQDEDRARKSEETKACITDAKTTITETVQQVSQKPPEGQS